MSNSAIVVTTIQEPTDCMRNLGLRAHAERLNWIVIGDRKGPASFLLPSAELVSIEQQKALSFKIAPLLPENSYARKNIGYLLAMSRGFNCIYETDDDTTPAENWRIRELESAACWVDRNSDTHWANVYQVYSSELIWPRGFPLNQIRRQFEKDFEISPAVEQITAPIQQGLINNSPDVDAVWRLVLDHEIEFTGTIDISLRRGIWCPFNSQNTWWWKSAFPLMYLPSYCSFRMTDIWRSFVAQRCLWELSCGVEFHRADAVQKRNAHDLTRDFEQEVPGYLRNDHIRQALEACDLSGGQSHLKENVFKCYKSLVGAREVSKDELPLVDAWLEDCP